MGNKGPKHPRYLESAEQIGQTVGISGEELLRQLRAKAAEPNYPTAECYLPSEVLDFEENGSLSPERARHMDACLSCRAMMNTLVPDPQRVQEFRQAVLDRRTMDQADRPIVKQRSRPDLLKLVFAFAVHMSVLGIFSMIALSMARFMPKESTPQFGSARLTATTEGIKSDISVPVTVNNGKLDEYFYPEAAAYAEITGTLKKPPLRFDSQQQGKTSNGPDENNLRMISALASVYRQNPGSSVDQQTRALKAALEREKIKILSIDPSGTFIVSFHNGTAEFEAREALRNTDAYVNVLKQNGGDPKFLAMTFN